MLVALGLVAWAAPVDAACENFDGSGWTFTQHAAGMPASSDSARTLESAELVVERGATDRLQGSVVLAAAPTLESDADLVVVLGSTREGSCEPFSTTWLRTHSPSDGVAREGATITLDLVVDDLPRQPDCANITVSGPGDSTSVHDRLLGRLDYSWHGDPFPFMDVAAKTPKRIPVGRWSRVRAVVVGRDLCDLETVRVFGKGRHIDARRITLRMSDDGSFRGRLPVRLTKARAVRLRVVAVGLDSEGQRIHRARTSVRLLPRR